MKPIGSLYQFLEPPLPTLLNNASSGSPNPSTTNLNSKVTYQLQPRKSRIKTTLDQYIPSNKSYLHNGDKQGNNLSHNSMSMETDTWKQLLQKYKMSKFREPGNANPITFPKKMQIIEVRNKSRLNIDQGLLRALEKVRLDDEKDRPENQDHEKSSSRYRETLEKLKLVPMMNLEVELTVPAGSQRNHQRSISLNPNLHSHPTQSPLKNNSPTYKIKQQKSNKTLSDTKRIEFERNLSWAKKHKKDEKYYKEQLGKIKAKEDWNKQVKKRKNLLSVLGERYMHVHGKLEGHGHFGHGHGHGVGEHRGQDRRHSVN